MKQTILATLLILCFFTTRAQVKVTEKQLVIPTYEIGKADTNPYFFKGERYQGASRRVYPYPMLGNFSDKLVDKSYTALILENEYVEVCVIPELGGKMYYAKDKTNDYYFIYRNQVVKPALIGMTGAWTSGGVEWNVPHHHRASTFSMVDYKVEEGKDGSKTVWVGETELRDYMKWAVGLTMYPGKAFVEATIRVMNTTPHKNSMLFWANASTHVNEDYQVIFPPRTQYATFHKKNQFTEWPISHQIYTGGDFRSGVDISQWKNHSISTSFFAWETQSNFVAGYDHRKKAGSVIFGSPYTNPGAKLWSWGNNEYGMLWNDILTDEDGPYVELMFGAFSDNQPDYSWLHPYETKLSKMFFMPSRDISSVKKVNKNGFLDFKIEGDKASIGVYTAAKFEDAQVVLKQGEKTIFKEKTTILPDQVYVDQIDLNEQSDAYFSLSLVSSEGEVLIEYTHLPQQEGPMPKTVKAPKTPSELSTADSLFYTGMRLEQFHEPQLKPMDYYQKALEKDPNHLKSNLRVGINYFRKRIYDKAEVYLTKVVNRTTFDYTTAEDAEGLYYTGMIQFRKGNFEKAYKLLYKATWDHEWAAPSHYQLALIKLQANDLGQALTHLNESLATNQRNIAALSTKLTVLRRLGKKEGASVVYDKILEIHPLNLRAHFENMMLKGEMLKADKLTQITASGLQAYLEVATKYGEEGFYEEALEIMTICKEAKKTELNANPIVYYLSAYYQSKLGNIEESKNSLTKATSYSVDYCFPSRLETQKALEWALTQQEDAKTLLYLGNLLYEKQPMQALSLWTNAGEKDEKIPMVNRNLAFAYANTKKDFAQAAEQMKLAILKNNKDPLYYTEQDKYLAKLNAPLAKRLELMEIEKEVVLSMNHSASTYLKLLVLNNRYDQALELMDEHHFRTWEGDEKRAYEYWVYAHLVKTSQAIQKGNLKEANSLLAKTLSRPKNIDVPIHNIDFIVNFFQGLVAEKMGNKNKAKDAFEKSTKGEKKGRDITLFAGLAYQKLNNQEKADAIFQGLLEKGNQLLVNKETPEFFNPFSREISENENLANAYYLLALGNFGKGERAEAEKLAKKAIELNNTLVGLTFRLVIDGQHY